MRVCVNFLITIKVLFLLSSCSQPKMIIKTVKNEDITVRWYYYSHLTNNSPDIIDVVRNDSIVEIIRIEERSIADLSLEKDNIIITIAYSGNDSAINFPTHVFEYNIIVDTISTVNMRINFPKGKKEKWW